MVIIVACRHEFKCSVDNVLVGRVHAMILVALARVQSQFLPVAAIVCIIVICADRR